MAIFSMATDQFRSYSYTVDIFQILIEGEEPLELPPVRFKSFLLLDDYANNIRPLFRVQLILEPSVYYKIIKNKNKVQFRIRLLKFFTPSSGGDTLNNDGVNDSVKMPYIDDVFELVLDDADVDAELGLKEEKANLDQENLLESDINVLEEVDNECEFFLFKRTMIDQTQTVVNAILRNSTLADAICYIATKAGMDNLLMSVPDNQRVYSQIVIPPLPAYKAIQFLDTYYGLYRCGAIIYFALDRSYIIKFQGLCTAFEREENRETTIVIPKKTNNEPTRSCSVYKKDNSAMNYIQVDQDGVSIRNDSISSNILTQNSITSVDTYDASVSNVSSGSITYDKEYSKTVENRTENIFFDLIYQSLTQSASNVIALTVGDYDIGTISPNKKFTVVFEDSNITQTYNGSYVLIYAYHSFLRNGNNYILTSNLVLRKTD